MRRDVSFLFRLAAVVLIAASGTGPWCPAAEGRAQDDRPEIITELGRNQIYEGESVLYQVTMNNMENPPEPDLGAFVDFRVELVSSTPIKSYSSFSINGRTTEVRRFGKALRYRLWPKKSGILIIPAPTAEVDGERLVGRALRLEVVAVEKQDLAIMELAVDKTRAYLMQPFTVTLTIYVKTLPHPHSAQSPISFSEAPALNIPYVEEIDGLDTDTISNWLSPIMDDKVGFSINNLTAGRRHLMSLFDTAPLGRFVPERERVDRPDGSGKPTEYVKYTLTRRFTPKKTGDFVFGPVTLKGRFVTHVDARNQVTSERIYAVAGAQTVTVIDAPLDGRPDSFIGAVGRFTVDADLNPPRASVGDPVTFTLTVRGAGTLERAFAPPIGGNEAVAERFKVYDATEETKGRSRVFTYSIRPLSEEVTEFPPVPVTWFDWEGDRFKTVWTEAIPIEVAAADHLDDGDIVSGAREAGRGRSIEAQREGIFADVMDLSGLRDQSIRPERWAALWAGMGGVYLLAAFGLRLGRKRYGDPAALRRRAAPARAQALLREAQAFFGQERIDDGVECVKNALTRFVADLRDANPEGLTHRDLEQGLIAAGLDAAGASEIARIREECDAARFGLRPAEAVQLGTDAQAALDRAVRGLRQTRSNRSARSSTVPLLLAAFCLLFSSCGAGPDTAVSRKLQEAQAAFLDSQSPDDYLRVAALYGEVLDRGFLNGAVLFNQGNAYMRAGQKGRAVAAYRRAIRYKARDEYLKSNLELALGRSADPPSRSLVDHVFFWQEWLSFPEKVGAATAAWAFTLLLAFFGLLWRPRGVRRALVWTLFIAALLLMTSAALDWYRHDVIRHGVVVADEVIARKGNARSFAPAFSEPLREGAEFIVREERENWLQIELDAGPGWIEKQDTVVY